MKAFHNFRAAIRATRTISLSMRIEVAFEWCIGDSIESRESIFENCKLSQMIQKMAETNSFELIYKEDLEPSLQALDYLLDNIEHCLESSHWP